MEDVQAQILRTMTPEKKLELAQQLREMAWELKALGVRMQDPSLSEAQVEERVREIFLNART